MYLVAQSLILEEPLLQLAEIVVFLWRSLSSLLG
jgi:hypothetical protein